jgi:rhomboid protease GluP
MNQPSDNHQGTPASDNAPFGAYPPSPVPQRTRIEMPQVAPYVTYAIIAITALAYFLQWTPPFGNTFIETLIKSNDQIRAGQLWRLLTPALLHANLMHIGFNMYALLSFGTGLERHFGHGRFLLLYVLGAFAGNVMSFLMTTADSLGASTAIFALVGAEAMFLVKNRKLFAGQFRSAIGNIIFIVVINLVVIGSLANVDNWGHIGGLVGGLIFGWLGSPIWEIEGIAPVLHLVDQRPMREVLTGAALVVLVFGGLAMWGMVR